MYLTFFTTILFKDLIENLLSIICSKLNSVFDKEISLYFLPSLLPKRLHHQQLQGVIHESILKNNEKIAAENIQTIFLLPCF